MLKTILFIDDDKNIREIFKLYFNSKYNCLFAKDGQEGLSLISRNNVDLIILDLMMANLDGFNFAKTIRFKPEYYFLPIIAVTAKVDIKSIKDAKQAGINMFIAKPFQLEVLEEHINFFLEKKQRQKEEN